MPKTRKFKQALTFIMNLFESSGTVKVDGEPVGYISTIRGFPLFIPYPRENCLLSERNEDHTVEKHESD